MVMFTLYMYIILVCCTSGEPKLTTPLNLHGKDLLIDGQVPKYGQIFRNQLLSNTLKVFIIPKY